MSNSVTGVLRADLNYRFYQEDDISIVEDVGIIDYELNYASGTGQAQTNTVWYAEKEVTGTDSIDLSALPTNKIGLAVEESFIGTAQDGLVKGFKIYNRSPNILFYKMPFFLGADYSAAPPSGQISFSNIDGWTVNSGDQILISGNGSLQRYDITLIGSAMPMVINADSVTYLEFTNSSNFSSALLLDYGRDVDSTGSLINFEWLQESAVSSTGHAINIEYLGQPEVAATGNLEFSARRNLNHKLYIEYEDYQISGVSQTLPKNRNFFTDYNVSGLNDIEDSGTQPYPFWTVVFSYGARTPEVGYTTTDYVWEGDHFNNSHSERHVNINDALVVVDKGVPSRDLIYVKGYGVNVHIYQKMKVIANQTYRFTCDIIKGYYPQYAVNENKFGEIHILDGMNNLLTGVFTNNDGYDDNPQYEIGEIIELSVDVVSTDGYITLLFVVPQDTPEEATFWDEWPSPEEDYDAATRRYLGNRFIFRNILLTQV